MPTAAPRYGRPGQDFLPQTKAVWDLAGTGAEVSLPLRAELYASTFHVLDTARDTVSQLYARGTRAAFMRGNPLERALRNLHAIAFGYESSRGLQHSAGAGLTRRRAARSAVLNENAAPLAPLTRMGYI